MTKEGYTHIIVSKQLHTQLKQLSKNEGLSISKLIENLLSINTSINTSQENTSRAPLSSIGKEAQKKPARPQAPLFM